MTDILTLQDGKENSVRKSLKDFTVPALVAALLATAMRSDRTP
jgi:hypothetical protein